MTLHIDLAHDGPPLRLCADIPLGQITALVGPSGSGKTSILRAIAGLLPLRQACIRLGDETWAGATTQRPTRERSLGFVSQSYGLFPHLSALENVTTALLDLPATERLARARESLQLARLDGLEARYPRQLSGGQRQRVALARAIARRPRLLLLDEPFSSVDRSTKKRLYVELLRLHALLGCTIVLVTHDLDEAAQLAAHLLLIRRGRLVQAGPTAQVLTQPRTEEAARLLDIANIFDGAVDAGGTATLRWGTHCLSVDWAERPNAGPLRWAVLSANVVLLRPDKPHREHPQNLVGATVSEVVMLGGEALVWLRPEGVGDTRLQMRLPARAVARYAVRAGQRVCVSLRPADIIPLQ